MEYENTLAISDRIAEILMENGEIDLNDIFRDKGILSMGTLNEINSAIRKLVSNDIAKLTKNATLVAD